MIASKICIECEDSFPIEEFKARQYYRGDKKIHISRDSRCTECRLEHQKILRRVQREVQAENTDPNSSLSKPVKDFLYGSK